MANTDSVCYLLSIPYALLTHMPQFHMAYCIGTSSIQQLRKNNATTFVVNKSAELRIPIPKDNKWTRASFLRVIT